MAGNTTNGTSTRSASSAAKKPRAKSGGTAKKPRAASASKSGSTATRSRSTASRSRSTASKSRSTASKSRSTASKSRSTASKPRSTASSNGRRTSSSANRNGAASLVASGKSAGADLAGTVKQVATRAKRPAIAVGAAAAGIAGGIVLKSRNRRRSVLGIRVPKQLPSVDPKAIAAGVGEVSRQFAKTSKSVSKDLDRAGDRAERIAKILD